MRFCLSQGICYSMRVASVGKSNAMKGTLFISPTQCISLHSSFTLRRYYRHGRPKRFKGSWYTSVFIHYYPVGWDDHDSVAETHYSIPPQWSADPTPANVDRAVMVGTAMKEPDCPDEWCGLKDAVKWQGGGIEGEVLTTNHHKYDLKHWRDEL